MKTMSPKPSRFNSTGKLLFAVVSIVTIYTSGFTQCNGQQLQQQLQQQQQQQLQSTSGATRGGTTLVVSQNPNGGISVVDRATNQQVVNTNSLEVNSDDEGPSGDAESNAIVGGLLEWLKKRKKKKDQEKQPIILPYPVPQPQPMPMPMPMPLPQPMPHFNNHHHHHQQPRKEIHIHINNHIKKHDNHHDKKHGGSHKKHGHHYKDYHNGHYDNDYHDKHYHGKHSYPLLGHHLSFDHFEHYLGGGVVGGGHGDHHDDDDYSGYESKSVAQYATSESNGSKQMKQTQQELVKAPASS